MVTMILALMMYFEFFPVCNCSYVGAARLRLLHDMNYSISKKCAIDVILIPGLGGNADSFKNEKHGTILYDLLRNDPKLKTISKRIWIYLYPNSFTKHSSNRVMSLENRATNLLSQIIHSDITEDDNNNPILFVAHSMGGLIVKRLVIDVSMGTNSNRDHQKEDYNIYKRIPGVIFYGTPHLGSDIANIFKLITGNDNSLNPLTFISDLFGYSPSTTIDDLQTDNPKLLKLNKEFNKQADEMNIVSFFEQRPEPEAIKLNINTLIVPEHSALLLTQNERSIPLDYCHTQLTKPDGYDDLRYSPIRSYIKKLIPKKNKEEKPETIETVMKVKVSTIGNAQEVGKKSNTKPIKTPFHQRNIDVSVKGRFQLSSDPWVWDGTARDIKTGMSVKSKGWMSREGARKHAMEELKNKLRSANELPV